MRILGVDPGSISTGFGVIDYDRGRLTLVEQGSIATARGADLADRLCRIHEELLAVCGVSRGRSLSCGYNRHRDQSHQQNPFHGPYLGWETTSTRAGSPRFTTSMAFLSAARTAHLDLFEYAPRSVKSAVVGYGAAEKAQVAKMVRVLLPGCAGLVMSADASDALAVAICHAHTSGTAARMKIAR